MLPCLLLPLIAACPETARSAGDLAAPGPGEVPFEEVFALHNGVECRAQSFAMMLSMRFTDGTYQFGDCTLDVEASAGVRDVAVTLASGPARTDSPWELKAVADVATHGRLQISAKQKQGFVDWSEVPLVLRLDFLDATGTARFSLLTLKPARESDLIHLEAPRAAESYVTQVWLASNDRIERFSARLDVDGTLAFRPEETIRFESPFTLAEGVIATRLGGTWQVALDAPFEDDTCVFGNVLPAFLSLSSQHAPFSYPGEPPHLTVESGPATGRCRPRPGRASGVISFDAHMGEPPRAGRFAVRFVGELKDDITFEIDRDESELREIRIVNRADYTLPLGRLRVEAMCEGNSDITTRPILDLSEASSAMGRVVDVPSIPIGGAAHFAGETVRAALRDAPEECPSGRWQIYRLMALESEPSGYDDLSILDFNPTLSVEP